VVPEHETARRGAVPVPEFAVLFVQVAPASLVDSMKAAVPTATHMELLGQVIANRWLVVSEASADQVAPLSVLFRTAPSAPAAKQTEVLGQLTPARKFPPLAINELQPVPPFVVRTTWPKSPTATHVVVLAQLIPSITVEMPVG
jgi:hypothetical protein